RWKLWMFRQLYKRGMNRPDIVQLLRFVDWMMVLPDSMKKSFSYEWDKLEEEHKMTYMMDIERAGYDKGIEQGINQGINQGIHQERKRSLDEQREILVGLLNYCYQLSRQQQAEIEEALQSIESKRDLKTLINICLDRKPLDVFEEMLNELISE
ncbi:MAG: hypothetical protein AAF639_16970, partial [Chloroflexota bacterium]